MRRAAAAVLCLLAVSGQAGCGSSSSDEARKAAEGYVAKLGRRDGRGTCEQMTTGLQRQFVDTVARADARFRGHTCAEVMQLALDAISPALLRGFATAKIDDLKVDGDSGTFRYTLGSTRVDGRVAKEDGDWKVSCCVPRAGTGSGGG